LAKLSANQQCGVCPITTRWIAKKAPSHRGISMKNFYQQSPEEQARCLMSVAKAALGTWNIPEDARIELIKHRENAVFRIVDDGNKYAMRVHRADYHTDAELDSELKWITAINSDDLRTPQVIPTSRGDNFARIKVDEIPEERQVDLLEWFEGEPIATIEAGVTDVSSVTNTFFTVGQLMATTHNHSESWELPEGFVRHAWDEDGILGGEPFWGRYWELPGLDHEQRTRLVAVKDKATSELIDFGKSSDRYGLIHADFLPENLLRSDQDICLIDFDDAGFGWHLFDLATTLFFHLGESYFDDACDALIEGYCTRRALPDEHLGLLPTFFLLRGLTYLGWAYTRSETETAKEMTPMMIEAVDEMAKDYLSGS
jgi:Ser/Thr protein kinase RdoA (MazF antagonist)